MKAIVAGMIATYPIGGVAWDYGQYALGLEGLGIEVTYLEDTGLPSYTYDPLLGEYREDPSEGIAFLEASLRQLSPTLGDRWHVRAADGRSFGLSPDALADAIAEADLFVNVSGACLLRPEYRRLAGRTVFIDTDPGWNHFAVFPRWDEKPAAERGLGFRGHDRYFTYASRLGRDDCPLPDFGLDWQTTLPPVVTDRWRPEPPGKSWTTVTMWQNYETPIEHGGRRYGSKDIELAKVEDLPSRVTGSLELAVYGNPQRDVQFGAAPRARWAAAGWSVINGRDVSRTMADYRDYIQRSRGEFSVAKNVYVGTRSGWFSCRSVCYLAAGRPVVLQDTGWSETLSSGAGLLPYHTVGEAADAIATVERDYDAHARAARDLACRVFDARVVLAEFVERAVP